MKKIKAWGIFSKDGRLLFTDKEACIYISYKEAVKEKGSHLVRLITISVHKLNARKLKGQDNEDFNE